MGRCKVSITVAPQSPLWSPPTPQPHPPHFPHSIALSVADSSLVFNTCIQYNTQSKPTPCRSWWFKPFVNLIVNVYFPFSLAFIDSIEELGYQAILSSVDIWNNLFSTVEGVWVKGEKLYFYPPFIPALSFSNNTTAIRWLTPISSRTRFPVLIFSIWILTVHAVSQFFIMTLKI
jgi:hypothetical protein